MSHALRCAPSTTYAAARPRHARLASATGVRCLVGRTHASPPPTSPRVMIGGCVLKRIETTVFGSISSVGRSRDSVGQSRLGALEGSGWGFFGFCLTSRSCSLEYDHYGLPGVSRIKPPNATAPWTRLARGFHAIDRDDVRLFQPRRGKVRATALGDATRKRQSWIEDVRSLDALGAGRVVRQVHRRAKGRS